MKIKHKRRFRKLNSEWMMKRLLNKKVYGADDVSIILGNDVKNVHELVRRGRLKSISNKLPYLFEASTVKSFVRQKPGPKPGPKPKILKRFIPKLKSTMRGGDPDVEK